MQSLSPANSADLLTALATAAAPRPSASPLHQPAQHSRGTDAARGPNASELLRALTARLKARPGDFPPPLVAQCLLALQQLVRCAHVVDRAAVAAAQRQLERELVGAPSATCGVGEVRGVLAALAAGGARVGAGAGAGGGGGGGGVGVWGQEPLAVRRSAAREAGEGGARAGDGGVVGPWSGQETVHKLVGLVAGSWLRCTDTQEAGQAEEQQLQQQAEQLEKQPERQIDQPPQQHQQEQQEPVSPLPLLSLADAADDLAAFTLLGLPGRGSGGIGSNSGDGGGSSNSSSSSSCALPTHYRGKSSSSGQASHGAATGAGDLWWPIVRRVEDCVLQHVEKGLGTYHRYGRVYGTGAEEATTGEHLGADGTRDELPEEAGARAGVVVAGQGQGVDAAALVRVVGALEDAGCLSGGVLMGAGQLLGCVAREQAAAMGGPARVGREGQLGSETDEEEGVDD